MCQGYSMQFYNGGIQDGSGQIKGTLPTTSFPVLYFTSTTNNLGTILGPNPTTGANVTYTIYEGIIHRSAEHTFNGKRSPFELQLFMTGSDGTSAAMAFLVNQTATGDSVTQTSSVFSNILASSNASSSGSYTGQTAALGTGLNALNFQQTQNFARNTKFYMYPGTRTYAPCDSVNWFVFDRPVYVSADTVSQLNYVFTNANLGTLSTIITTRQELNGRSITATGCWPSYFFQNPVRYNFGFWTVIGFVIFYFIIALYCERDLQLVDDTFNDNVWTFWAPYSIWYTGGEYFTKTSRLTLLWLSMVTIMCIDMVFFVNLTMWNDVAGPALIVYPLFAIFCSWPINYIFGLIINRVYALQRVKFLTKKCPPEIDIDINTWWFLFYFPAYLWTAFGVVITAWQNSYTDTTVGSWWFLSLWIGWAVDIFFFDILIVFVCWLIPSSRWWFKIRGFWFDYELFQAVKKVD